jgi:hypothetical protein
MTTTNQAQEIERRAIAAGRERERARQPIDYARMSRVFPKQKAALTRAIKSGSRETLILTIRAAVLEWNEIGAWPDDWARWQRALDDFRGPGDVGWHPYPFIDIADLAR